MVAQNESIIFYGAGLFARQNLKNWEEKGLIPTCFVDSSYDKWHQVLPSSTSKGKTYEILPLHEALRKYPYSQFFISTSKPLINEIAHFLIRSGIPRCRIINYSYWRSAYRKIQKIKLISIMYFLRYFIILLDSIFPKNEKKIVFRSIPEFSDNALEFYKYITRNHPSKYIMRWVFIDSIYQKNPNFKAVLNRFHPDKCHHFASFKGLYHLLTCKYIVCTHADLIFDFISMKRHCILNLWHGMPVKTIGFSEPMLSRKLTNRYLMLGKNVFFFTTSDIFKLCMATSCYAKYKNIFVTGQPRTDCCFHKSSSVEKLLVSEKTYNKIFLYLPTYKERSRNYKKDVNSELNNIFYMKDYDENKFDEYLQKENTLLLVKPHPFDEIAYMDFLRSNKLSENIKVFFNLDFISKNIYLYEIFPYANCLISDFSSAAIDFMILNKPVLFMDNLTEEYKQNRGMIFPDNYEIFLQGAKVKTFDQLLINMKAISKGDDKYKEQREAHLKYMHKYLDDKASERIYKNIFEREGRTR